MCLGLPNLLRSIAGRARDGQLRWYTTIKLAVLQLTKQKIDLYKTNNGGSGLRNAAKARCCVTVTGPRKKIGTDNALRCCTALILTTRRPLRRVWVYEPSKMYNADLTAARTTDMCIYMCTCAPPALSHTKG